MNTKSSIARIIEKAVTLFEGDHDAAMRWLASPNPDLDGQIPLNTAETEIGARAVEDLIGRLEFGVFN